MLEPAISCVSNQTSTSVPEGNSFPRRYLIDSNPGVSDFSDSLNLVNSLKVAFYLGKTPLIAFTSPKMS